MEFCLEVFRDRSDSIVMRFHTYHDNKPAKEYIKEIVSGQGSFTFFTITLPFLSLPFVNVLIPMTLYSVILYYYLV